LFPLRPTSRAPGFDGVFGGTDDNPLGMFGESTSMLPKGVLEDDSFDDPAEGGEGDMQWMDLPDDLQEQSPIIDDFNGGRLMLSMYGCMQQQDLETLSEFTEYVVLCSWGTPEQQGEVEQWLVFTRYEEIRDMHKGLRKRLAPVTAGHLAYPKFPARDDVASSTAGLTKAARLEARLRGLQAFFTELTDLLKSQRSLQSHVDELDEFFALTEHITSIKRNLVQVQEQTAREKRKAEDPAAQFEEEEVSVLPLDEAELEALGLMIQQLWRLIINAQADVREDYNIQQLLHKCLELLPRLGASAEVGPFSTYELIDQAEQCLYDMQEVISLYNDEALLYQIGAAGMAGDFGGYSEDSLAMYANL